MQASENQSCLARKNCGFRLISFTFFFFFTRNIYFFCVKHRLVGTILLDLIHMCTNWLFHLFILLDTSLTIRSTSLLPMPLLLRLQRTGEETGAIISLHRIFQKLVSIPNFLFIQWEDLLNSMGIKVSLYYSGSTILA